MRAAPAAHRALERRFIPAEPHSIPQRREALLDFVEFPGPHSGENMAAVILAMLHELNIAPKLLIVVVFPYLFSVLMDP